MYADILLASAATVAYIVTQFARCFLIRCSFAFQDAFHLIPAIMMANGTIQRFLFAMALLAGALPPYEESSLDTCTPIKMIIFELVLAPSLLTCIAWVYFVSRTIHEVFGVWNDWFRILDNKEEVGWKSWFKAPVQEEEDIEQKNKHALNAPVRHEDSMGYVASEAVIFIHFYVSAYAFLSGNSLQRYSPSPFFFLFLTIALYHSIFRYGNDSLMVIYSIMYLVSWIIGLVFVCLSLARGPCVGSISAIYAIRIIADIMVLFFTAVIPIFFRRELGQ